MTPGPSRSGQGGKTPGSSRTQSIDIGMGMVVRIVAIGYLRVNSGWRGEAGTQTLPGRRLLAVTTIRCIQLMTVKDADSARVRKGRTVK